MANKLATMFEGFNSAILLSYLQGHMGTAWVDNLESPTAAQVTVGIFVYYAGDSNAREAVELLHNLPDYTFAISHSNEWKEKIEVVHKGRTQKFQRCSFKKSRQDLNQDQLLTYRSMLPKEYELRKIDSELLTSPSLHELSEDFVSQFNDSNDFLDRGVGFCILYQGEAVCGATSYCIYDKGIEIEIATDPKHRRKGLATVAASAIILDCLNKGIYPSWDAANSESTSLAKKLGYNIHSEYDTYYIHSDAVQTA